MGTNQTAPHSVPAPASSPFLQSEPTSLPSLQQIKLPIGAVKEFQQQVHSTAVDLPIPKARSSKRVHAEVPTAGCPPAFKYAFNAFCTARRCMSPSTLDEAEAMVSSEAFELIASKRGDSGKGNSLDPRGICLSLVIPHECINNANTIALIDGFAALSDLKSKTQVPIATKIRFTIYGDNCVVPIENALKREAFDNTVIDTVSIVARWSESDAAGASRVRSECFSLGVTTPPIEEAARHIQTAVVKMSTMFGFSIPPDFFRDPPQPFAGYYEQQVADCSKDWRALLHHEEPFSASDEMLRSHKNVLVRVPGCYVRLSPIALGLAGVTSSEVIHAVLLCAEGMESKALDYCKTYREGLRPPDGEDELLDLHTIALHTERVYLNGMISLYGHGGRSGEPIKPDGNWVYKTNAAVVPIKTLMDRFFVMSCDMHSMMPENAALTKFMDKHMQKSLRLYDALFATNDYERITLAAPSAPPPLSPTEMNSIPEDERFIFSALGVDLKSERMLIGEAISFLMQSGAPTSLVEMLTATGSRVGLSSKLSDGYAYCTDILKKEQKHNEVHASEVARLKRVADAALLVCANKRACRGVPGVPPEKVRALLKLFSLKKGPHVTRLDDFVTIPRCSDLVRSIVWTIYESYTRRSNHEADMKQALELQKILEEYTDFVYAICKSLQICMCAEMDANKKEAFVIVHGHEMSNVSIYSVTDKGEPEQCGCGKVFEAKMPSILILKLRSDVSCIVTPLITE